MQQNIGVFFKILDSNGAIVKGKNDAFYFYFLVCVCVLCHLTLK